LLLVRCWADYSADVSENYLPKTCKYPPLPDTLDSVAYLSETTDVHIGEVFGLSKAEASHRMTFTVKAPTVVNLRMETHYDETDRVVATLYALPEKKLVQRGKVDTTAGGDQHGVFLSARIEAGLYGVDVSVRQRDKSKSGTDRSEQAQSCDPVRVDLSILSVDAARTVLPNAFAAGGTCRWPAQQPHDLGEVTLGEQPVLIPGDTVYTWHPPTKDEWRSGPRSIWYSDVVAPRRLNRFVRLTVSSSFRFEAIPLNLIAELFFLDSQREESEVPKCNLGCVGGTSTSNGVMLNSALPSGFVYRIWLIARRSAFVEETDLACLPYNFKMKAAYETKFTPFEVGPAAWMCEATQLPVKVVQSRTPQDIDSGVTGINLRVRDWFMFPETALNEMEVEIPVSLSEPCILRAAVDKADFDVHMKLTKGDSIACTTNKVVGPGHALVMFCALPAGEYSLTLFGTLPLGGVQPCSSFFFTMAVEPMQGLQPQGSCNTPVTLSASDLVDVSKEDQTIQMSVPLRTKTRGMHTLGKVRFTIPPGSKQKALRIQVMSDPLLADVRFQLQLAGEYIADPKVSSSGFMGLLDNLDSGDYELRLFAFGLDARDPSVASALPETTCVPVRVLAGIREQDNLPGGRGFACQMGSQRLPAKIQVFANHGAFYSGKFLVDRTSVQISIQAQVDSVLRLSIYALKGRVLLYQGANVVADDPRRISAKLSSGLSYLLQVLVSLPSGSVMTCPMLGVNLHIMPTADLISCPWSPTSRYPTSRQVTSAQSQAADHIGGLLLDMAPSVISKEPSFGKPKMVWWAPGMSSKFPVKLGKVSSVRVEVTVSPPFLPLRVRLWKMQDTGTSHLPEPAAVADWTENRLLLLESDIAPGDYQLEIDAPAEGYPQFSCAHVLIRTDFAESSVDAQNQIRAELMEMPDLFAVEDFPTSLNAVGMLIVPELMVVQTHIYAGNGNGRATLTVSELSLLRLSFETLNVAEPNAQVTVIDATGKQVGTADDIGHLAVALDAGTYTLTTTMKAANIVTLAVGPAKGFVDREQSAHGYSQVDGSCGDFLPVTMQQVGDGSFAATLQGPPSLTVPLSMRLAERYTHMRGTIATFQVPIKVPSLLYIEAGANFALDMLSIGVEVPEGVWVGEQRGRRNSLRIEVPPATYNVIVKNPEPIEVKNMPRCLDLSLLVTTTPLNAKDAEEQSDSVLGDSQCLGAGALVPRPLPSRRPTNTIGPSRLNN
jgi:hypothetical protein